MICAYVSAMTPQEKLSLLVNEKIMGYDIGKKGGIAININGSLVMENLEEDARSKFLMMQRLRPNRIIAENVHTIVGCNMGAMGELMRQRGHLEGVAAALNIPINWVEPPKWIECYTMKRKRHFTSGKDKEGKDRKDGRAWKEHLMEIADSMYPSETISLATADAVLMWDYQASEFLGEPKKKIGIQLFSTPETTDEQRRELQHLDFEAELV